jgi:hypothetical protein
MMKKQKDYLLLMITIIAVLAFGGTTASNAQTTQFTYQGRFTDSTVGSPTNGMYQMQFALYDAVSGGNLVGQVIDLPAVQVVNGIFTVQLDYGSMPFSTQDVFVELRAFSTVSNSYVTLTPRQKITSAPFAIKSKDAENAANAMDSSSLGGVPAGFYLQKNGDGSALTNLNASSVATGVLNDARLSQNVARRNAPNTFSSNITINSDLTQTGSSTNLTLTSGFVVKGSFAAGALPASGPGVRMLFYPHKAAFRAGNVDSTQWDDANIGNSSVALGLNTTASGGAATALGDGTLASGLYSTAFGILTKATGDKSTSMGYFSIASGENSTAMGLSTTASGMNSTAIGEFANTNSKDGSFVYGDGSSGFLDIKAVVDNQFVVRAQNIWLGKNNSVTATAGRFIETSTGAYLSAGGTWTNASSRDLKTNFEPVDPRMILRKVTELPMQSWNYKADSATVRHIGAISQDFYKAFQLGDSDRAIATVDGDGVALAAIQGLNEELNDRDKRIDRLEQILDKQQKQMDALKEAFCGQNIKAEVCGEKK